MSGRLLRSPAEYDRNTSCSGILALPNLDPFLELVKVRINLVQLNNVQALERDWYPFIGCQPLRIQTEKQRNHSLSPSPKHADFKPYVGSGSGPRCQEDHELAALIRGFEYPLLEVISVLNVGVIQERARATRLNVRGKLLGNPRVSR